MYLPTTRVLCSLCDIPTQQQRPKAYSRPSFFLFTGPRSSADYPECEAPPELSNQMCATKCVCRCVCVYVCVWVCVGVCVGVRVGQLPRRRDLRPSSGSLCSAQVLHEPLPLRWRELVDALHEPVDLLLRINPPQPVPVLVQDYAAYMYSAVSYPPKSVATPFRMESSWPVSAPPEWVRYVVSVADCNYQCDCLLSNDKVALRQLSLRVVTWGTVYACESDGDDST